MKLNHYGKRKNNEGINNLVDLLLSVDSCQRWLYKGMIVTIDPSVDFNNNNALIRWGDISEGFNDRVIVNSKDEFLKLFTFISKDDLSQFNWVESSQPNILVNELDDNEGSVFSFKYKGSNEITTINILDYTWYDIVGACEKFGYSAKTIDKWITTGDESALICECIFRSKVKE